MYLNEDRLVVYKKFNDDPVVVLNELRSRGILSKLSLCISLTLEKMFDGDVILQPKLAS